MQSVYSLVGDEVGVSKEKKKYNQVKWDCLTCTLFKSWPLNNYLLTKSEAKVKFDFFSY